MAVWLGVWMNSMGAAALKLERARDRQKRFTHKNVRQCMSSQHVSVMEWSGGYFRHSASR